LTEKYILPEKKLYVLGTAGDNPFVEEGSSEQNAADIMIQKSTNRFIIHDKSEKIVIESYDMNMKFGLIVGFMVTMICLFFLLEFLKNLGWF
jgi:hypothetical protein